MQLFYTYFVLVSIQFCCLESFLLDPFAFVRRSTKPSSHHITVWNEICITYCLFVSSLICLPTLKESHCHIPILHTSWLSYAHRPSCIAKREDRNNNCIHSQSIIRRSKIFSLVVITLFVWHILFVSEEPKKERKWMIWSSPIYVTRFVTSV